MKIESKRFGTIEVKEDRILTLKGGLLGFSELTKFVLVDDQEDPDLPFRWLISVEQPEFGFLVTDPGIFFKDYVFSLSEEEQKALGVKKEDDITVLTLLTVPADPKMITTNLKGPLVFNSSSMEGKQIILSDGQYTTKHFIYLAATEQSDAASQKEAVDQAVQITAEAIKNSSATNKDVAGQS